MEAVIVRILGANDAWQGAADTARRRLTKAFGPQIQVESSTATSPGISPFPQALALIRLSNAPLPLVFIGGQVLIPAISRRLEALGVRRDGGQKM